MRLPSLLSLTCDVCWLYRLPDGLRLLGVSNMNYRIIRYDKRNWCIEKWVHGGKVINHGKSKGKASTSRWVNQGLY